MHGAPHDDRERVSFRELASLTPKQNAGLDAALSRRRARLLVGGAGFGGKSRFLRAFCMFMAGKYRSLNLPYPQKITLATSSYEALRDRHFSHLVNEYGPNSNCPLGELRTDDKEYGRCFKFFDRRMGAILLRNLADPNERRGSECAAAAVDELTEITRKQFGDFSYTVRSPLDLPWLPIAAGTNPDGIGHAWVKGTWRPKLAGEARLLPFTQKELAGLNPADYLYIQFLPDDNPTFVEEDFMASIAHLPEHIQRARRYGLWDAPEGARWPFLDEEVQLFDPEIQFPHGIPPSWVRILHVDYGHRAPYCALWTAIDHDRNAWTYREDYQAGLTADAQAFRIAEKTKDTERLQSCYFDPSMWATLPAYTGPTELSLIDMYDAVLGPDARFGPLVRGYNRSRVHALGTLDKMLRRDNGHPNWFISKNCPALWGELQSAIWDQSGVFNEKKEDIDARCADHAITAGYYGLHTFYESPSDQKSELDPDAFRDALRRQREELEHHALYKHLRKRN